MRTQNTCTSERVAVSVRVGCLLVAPLLSIACGTSPGAPRGRNFARVGGGQTPEALVWGTVKNVYAM